MINRKSWLAAGLSLSLGGCAAWAVTQDALVDRTAHALGLEKNQFKIENRVDDGVTTRYSVKTDSGQQYNCYVAARSRCWGGWFRKLSAAKRASRPEIRC
ncbi:hypothetical protein [Methylomonas koyamae]|uniref:hypothetical protein n=1 Tax=Methylomonas koyamae TaxID=702114 RepID=UPI0006D0A446|nr:hypothetical protein [Methylomonas koyamae]